VLPAEWLSNSSDVPGRVTSTLERALHSLAQPARVRRSRQILFALFALWGVLALSRLVWALLPAADSSVSVDTVVLNPVPSRGAAASADSIDIDRLRAWHLFGEAGAEAEVAIIEEVATAATVRDGIEQGARETHLDLKLRGIVASTEDGLGHAIIEYKSRQALYAVEDKLPVSGQVVLAKVMPAQVVLDNSGTYELLLLFEGSDLGTQLSSGAVSVAKRKPAPNPAAAGRVDKRADADATALALSYRDRLYQNPQSLAEVVSVSAVREDGELLGYRISPGKDPGQFEQLGFKPGDLVTGINGIALNDPANTMRLYQAMRSASEAVFELKRENQQLTVSVSLDEGAAQ
jgi:general secretion pathway protein C